MILRSLSADASGELLFAQARVSDLAKKYGTPLYLMDENKLRENMRTYADSMKAAFSPASFPTYANKALCFKALFPMLDSEGLGADVVSGGELYTALRAGYPTEKLFFHGNNKSPWEMELALDNDVGCFMIDNEFELHNLSRMAGERRMHVKAMLRITPGIDPHTFAAVNTGKLDCQFGEPVETGQALEFVKSALHTPNITLIGLHCHIGSQIFTFEPFALAVKKMIAFFELVKSETGWEVEWLNLGGGFGVRYLDSDPYVDIPGCISELGRILEAECAARKVRKPNVIMEPGRSIVADAGVTIYRAGAVKEIQGHRTYVVVDGGMSDNPRYALYRAPYTVYNASRMNAPADHVYTIAGRCCEAGALLQENVVMPLVESGDLICFAVTGAYNYAMASNYNRVPRLPIVMVKSGEDRLVVRRETLDDLVMCDI